MAVYKVPQDVEADDKLLGPLSFRQFIYMSVAVGSAVIGFFLFRVFPGLVLIPLPFFLLFGALALPLRKDQPMEIYLVALARFYLKPKRRLWNPDGVITYVEITAPPVVETAPTGLDEASARERLDYLARVMDSRGWALKGVSRATPNDSLTPAASLEAADAPDIMDEQAQLAKSFDDLIARKKESDRQQVVANMRAAQPGATAAARPAQAFANNPYDEILQQQFPAPSAPQSTRPQPTPAPSAAEPTGPSPHFNPYPAAMRQKVVEPHPEQHSKPAAPSASTPETEPMTRPVPPAIMRLVTNSSGLSVSAIAHEANRLQEGEGMMVEVPLHRHKP